MRISGLEKGGQIAGVKFVKLDKNVDKRGAFTEVFKRSWDSPLDPAQFSVVHSEAGVMRGCHLHFRHDEYFCLLTGAACVGLRDERPGSDTFGVWSLYGFHEEDFAAVIFPRGLVHGWYFYEPSIHLQATSRTFEEYYDNDNHRIHWLDPDLEIPWPTSEAILSGFAEEAPGLKEIRKRRRPIETPPPAAAGKALARTRRQAGELP